MLRKRWMDGMEVIFEYGYGVRDGKGTASAITTTADDMLPVRYAASINNW